MCFKFFNSKIKNMNCFDISCIKLSVFFFTLMIAKLWSGILALEWYYYLILGLIFATFVMFKLFKK